MSRKKPTKSEQEHLTWIHTLGCCVCGARPVEAHHILHIGNKTRDHFRTLPLCHSHHTGTFSIHGARKSFRAKYGHEENLLEKIMKQKEES
jgi:hypothetical protein